jgi:hypothetical protein
MRWKDAWVENARVLVRLEDERVIKVGTIRHLLMMTLGQKALEEELMEKYGVDTDDKDPKVKEAKDKSKCPICGAELESQSNVPKCPVHGVAPFQVEDLDDTIPEV